MLKLQKLKKKTLCLIVNSAEYISEATASLVKTFKKLIDPSFVEKIEVEKEKNEFESVRSKALKALVHGLESKMDGAFQQMIKMPWSSWENVEDQSEYVNQISTNIQMSIPLYFKWIASPSNFQYFCSDFSLSFVPTLINQIFKCKRISEIGGQQLMIDFGTIKTLLLQIPSTIPENSSDKSGNARWITRYNKHVTKEMSKAEMLLKIISLTPKETLVETYKTKIPQANEIEFQKLLDLKGLPKNEQKTLIDQFKQSIESQSKKDDNSQKKLPQMGATLTGGITGVTGTLGGVGGGVKNWFNELLVKDTKTTNPTVPNSEKQTTTNPKSNPDSKSSSPMINPVPKTTAKPDAKKD